MLNYGEKKGFIFGLLENWESIFSLKKHSQFFPWTTKIFLARILIYWRIFLYISTTSCCRGILSWEMLNFTQMFVRCSSNSINGSIITIILTTFLFSMITKTIEQIYICPWFYMVFFWTYFIVLSYWVAIIFEETTTCYFLNIYFILMT